MEAFFFMANLQVMEGDISKHFPANRETCAWCAQCYAWCALYLGAFMDALFWFCGYRWL